MAEFLPGETITIGGGMSGATANGEQQQLYRDVRLHLEVDPKQVETWELVALESNQVSKWILIFPRYLSNGRGLVSPGLPNTPIDRLTKEEKQQITSSEAYKALERLKTPDLRAAANSFMEQLAAGF